MWLWPEYSRETKAPPVRILILDQQGVVRSSGKNTLTPVDMRCPACEAVVGDNYITACEKENPPAGSPDGRVVRALREVLQQDGSPVSLECGKRGSEPPVWHQIMILPLEGEQRGAMLLQFDVTERHQAQEELQRSHDEIQSLARRLIHAQEEERARIARELHDDICQRLAVHALQINSLHRNTTRNKRALDRMLAVLEKDAVDIGNAIRGFSRQLHPVMLERFGLVAAIREYCTRTAAQYGLELELTLGIESVDVTPSLAISVYRIIQEAFSNVARHAKASRVALILDQDNAGLTLIIVDNGVGFDPDDASRKTGLGLVSMKERVQSFSGNLAIASSPGRGTRVCVEIPLNFNTPNHETSTHHHS